jgi:hypothetical protein
MKWLSSASPRRTLLRRGLWAAGGLLGLAAGRQVSARDEPAPAPAAAEGERVVRLYGRSPAAVAPGKTAGGARVVRRSDLYDAPAGRSVGEFVATTLGAEASFGAQGACVSGLEMLSFRVGEDTLFGIGAGGARGAERAYAVLGGTGRFAGARGTCLEREIGGSGAPGRGHAEFVVTLVG